MPRIDPPGLSDSEGQYSMRRKQMKFIRKAAPAICIIAAMSVMIMEAYATIVNTSLAGYIGKIQPIPQSAAAAHRLCVRGDKGLEIGRAMEALGEELEKLTTDMAVPYGMESVESMKDQYGSEDMQSKLEGMTVEQKMAFGMQLQQQMGYGASTANQSQAPLIAECVKLNNEAVNFNSRLKSTERTAAIRTKYDTIHSNIDKATDAAVASCPALPSSGEKDPGCIRAKRLAGIDKQIQEADKEVKEYAAIYADCSAKLKQLATKVDVLMAKAQYGKDVSGTAYKEQFRSLQTLTVTKVMELYGMSAGIIVDTAKWIEQKDSILKQQ
jgi:hypothetical protein